MEQRPEPVQAHQQTFDFLPAAEQSGEPTGRLASPRAPHEPEPLHLRRMPLAGAACAFALGIAFAFRSGVSTPASLLLAGLCACSLLALFSLGFARRLALLPALAAWLILGLAAEQWSPAPAAGSSLLPFTDGLSRQLVGTVIRVRPLTTDPRASNADADEAFPWELAEASPAAAEGAVAIDLDVASAEEVTPDTARMAPASGISRIILYPGHAPLPTFSCGDRLELTVRLRPLQRYRDPGAWQYADYLAQQGILARGTATADHAVRRSTEPPTWRCRVKTAQTWASQRMLLFARSRANRHLPSAMQVSTADAGIIDAMLFGDRTALNRSLHSAFERTGSFHLFVVSGVHVALLAAAAFWFARRLRMPAWLATLITLSLASAYAVFTGLGAPVARSLAMVAVYLLARLLLRERSTFNALGAAALVMLVWSPHTLFDTGFQMTLLAVVAIAGLAHPLAERLLGGYAHAARDVFSRHRHTLPPRLAQLRLTLEIAGESLASALTLAPGHPVRILPAALLRALLFVTELMLIGIVAELVMVLPMALYFHRVTPWSLPANMLVIPLIGVLAPLAVLTFALALVAPALASIPGALLAGLLHLVTALVTHLGHLGNGDLRVPAPMPAVALTAVLLWLICCWAVRHSRTGASLAALALPLIAVLVLWREPVLRTPGALEVTALDVGQGDSLLLMSPAGQTMLVDAGGPIGSHGVSEIVSRFDLGEEVVSPYLWSRRIRRLDVAVLSHAHTDHMGGMPAVLENFRPRELWVSIDPRSPMFGQLLAEAARLGITVRHLHAGDRIVWSGLPISVLAPEPAYRNADTPKNDDSLVLEVDYGKSSVLLEGDAERPSERAMLDAGLVHAVTVLKVGHHGSNTSSSPEFLHAAQPRVALLSSGAGNPFGHPRAEVIGRLAALGIPLLRTDREGLSTVLLTPDGNFCEAVQGIPLSPPTPARTQ